MKNKIETFLSAFVRENDFQVDVGKIKELLTPGVGMRTILKEEKEIPLGCSKLGGHPDLPKDWNVPFYESLPLSFLCQINAEDVQKICKEQNVAIDFPDTGILYFFFEGDEMPHFGIDGPGAIESYRVLYYDGDHLQLERKTKVYEKHEKEVWNSAAISYQTNYYIPDMYNNPEYYSFLDKKSKNFNRLEDEYLVIHDGLSSLTQTEPSNWSMDDFGEDLIFANHHILGFSQDVQHDPIGEILFDYCNFFKSLTADEIETYDVLDVKGITNETIDKEKESWQLLLQLDTDDDVDWMWGDAGKLFFIIRKEDLKQNKFDRIGFTWQCY